jgi:hypothetical protein
MSDGIVRNVQASTSTLGLPVDILRASSEGGIDAAFRASARGASAYC